jgi:hypothetical protein
MADETDKNIEMWKIKRVRGIGQRARGSSPLQARR